jgi:hypothetical protein
VATKAKKRPAKKRGGGSSEEAFLRKKAAESRFSVSTLRKVLQRGKAAFLSSGSRPGTNMTSWSRGRVNSFVSGKGGARKADADLLRGGAKKKTKKA